MWSAATVGPGGGASGGVAIFARKEIGLKGPSVGSHEIIEGRAVIGMAEPQGHRPLCLTSVYLEEGEKLNWTNKRILAEVGKRIDAQGKECIPIIGGDFQNGPNEIAHSGFPAQVKGTVAAADTKRGTYCSSKGSSNIDLFVIAETLVTTVASIDLREGTGIKSHVPVQISFKPRPVSLRALTVRAPPKLPLERVYGPVDRPLDWGEARCRAEEALRAARANKPAKEVQARLDRAYAVWSNTAEVEISRITGEAPRKWRKRSKGPQLRWASVLPEKGQKTGTSKAAKASWIEGMAMELQRIAEATNEQAAGGFYLDRPWPEDNRPHGATFCTPVRGGYGGEASRSHRRHSKAGGGSQGEALHGQEQRATARGGRPRPARDLTTCREIINEILLELEIDEGEGANDEDIRRWRASTKTIGQQIAAALGPDGTSTNYIDEDLRERTSQLTTELADAVKYEEGERTKEDLRRWRDWLEEGWSTGARHAHAATKDDTEWRATVVKGPGGVLTADPIKILQSMREKYKQLWGATDEAMEYCWEGAADELPELTPREIRDASLSIPKRTTMTYDGSHVRHLSLIRDEGLVVL